MKRGTLSATVFAIACIWAAFLSGKILGTGFWGWAMLGGGIFVGISVHVPVLVDTGRTIGMLAGVLGLLAVALGLLAGTIGGSFKMPDDQALLLFLIFIIAVSGITFSRSKPRIRDDNQAP